MCEKEECMLPAGAGKEGRLEEMWRLAELCFQNIEAARLLLARLRKEKSDHRTAAVYEKVWEHALLARSAADTVAGMASLAKKEGGSWAFAGSEEKEKNPRV
jgi:hypothetical protein